ncbi:MAG: hypothetical protein GX022_08865 [Clostridiaceae bacterium]|nr:hypothetical protein [Clostridiaceae bacterium]
MNNFLSEWRKNRAEVYKKRNGFSRATDYIAIILIVFVAVSYIYHNITNKNENSKRQVSYGINSKNDETIIQAYHKKTFTQPEIQKQSVLRFFHISSIDIVIIFTAIGVYTVFRYCKRLKGGKEGDL